MEVLHTRFKAIRPTESIGKIHGFGILKLFQHSGARFRRSGRPTSAARYPVLMLFRGFSRRSGAENANKTNLLRQKSRSSLFAGSEKRRPGPSITGGYQ
jgi:hypothetical protein